MQVCPRCQAEIDEDEDWRCHEHCLYEPCDSEECRASKEPWELGEWIDAHQHWKYHRFLSGCSHGN